MRSFFIALLILLLVSYWAHVFVTHELNSSNELVNLVLEQKFIGICECRCCLLTGTLCESIIRQSLPFKNEFSCNLCTNDFCTMNISTTEQCQLMYTMKADCFQYEPREKSSLFVSVRPILQ
ncbi:unnamed protein product [Adineta steineri]|uniref:Uncharacterized protein n=1 Tax=Adineta steineri TaxID=433720 RepID=A0A814IC85_9BILA|nr:unnamed protein product [Adineta steineri]CAF1053983.1 unnamed protein product [Adineta steineri]CAF1183841.1 unnamed protein product [Adineta steineri]CAF1311560.1 unnamed protein product [Adineta steineri]CAF1314199.1 unnamed protein product [Adineta steineri]